MGHFCPNIQTLVCTYRDRLGQHWSGRAEVLAERINLPEAQESNPRENWPRQRPLPQGLFV